MTAARRISSVVVIVLVVVLALLPLQAWLRVIRGEDVRFSQPLDSLSGVTWAATLSSDGRLAITIVYDLDTEPRDASIRVPTGARFLRADGVPIPATIGRYGEVRTQGPLTVTYERVGAVTRYGDGVIVDFAGIENSDQALFPCARCSLDIEQYGNTSLAGALFAADLTGAKFAISGVEQLRTDDDDGALRFVGVLPGADQGRLAAWLPVEAAPDAPTDSGVPNAVTGETASQVWDAMLDATDEPLRTGKPPLPIGRLAAAVILSVMWGLLAAWIAWRIRANRRDLAADHPAEAAGRDAGRDTGAAFDPPSDLEPAVVGLLVGGAGRGDRSAVASTTLALAHRGVIRIDGIDSERYTLTIPPGAKGASPLEEVVLAGLRPQGQVTSTATLTGPPLWGAGGTAVARRLARAALREAKQARLLRVTLTPWVLIPTSLAMGIVALVASGGTSWLAWTVTFVGPLVALAATVLTGVGLTSGGRDERQRWLEYGRWLRANSRLRHVGAPGIATWGEPLVYAAVLGAAPTAADALGPDGREPADVV